MSERNPKGSTAKTYWRSLEERFDAPAFRARVAQEFPALARRQPDFDRRAFFKCLAGAVALAGLDGCERQPAEDSWPMPRMPEGGTPGSVRYYASAVELDGVGQPIIGKCRDGRPIKLEGNPDHPASAGATDAFTQAALLGLYDPDRSASPLKDETVADWDDVGAMMLVLREKLDATTGEGLRLLTGPIGSPTLLRQIRQMKQRWPAMRWHVHEASGLAGNADRVLRLETAHAVVCLDADPLGNGPHQTWHAQGWAKRRRAFQAGEGSALLLVAEPTPTLTGVAAQERLVAGHSRMEALLTALEAKLGGSVAGPTLSREESDWIEKATRTLQEQRGQGLLLVGAHHSEPLRRRADAINAALGNRASQGRAGTPGIAPDGDLAALVADMQAGIVKTLLTLETNPAYSAPADSGFGAAIQRVPLTVHGGLYRDETAEHCQWHLPLEHALESWSDVRCADGSVSLVQPLVRPFLDVRSRHEVLAMLMGDQTSARDLVRYTWRDRWNGDEQGWQKLLVSGVIPDSRPSLAAPASTPGASPMPLPARHPDGGLEVVFRPDPTVYDGSLAENPWLQELPKPLTKLTWDNAVLVSPAIAAECDLANEDIVELTIGPARVTGPAWIVPGQDVRTIVLHLGYGRRAGSEIARASGFDANALRTMAEPWHRNGAKLRKTGETRRLACTQTHWAMDGHDWVREVERPGETLPEKSEKANFYPPQPARSDEPAWGMAIDLDLCIGCNACATACVAENNVPMVGKQQVAMGREMHWLRIDRYYTGPVEAPEHRFQPVPCMHCEDAPCEMGCPVNATVHSPDGLNLQVYNRCIGTRTCSAFCPYKVRRFNWLDYTRDAAPGIEAQRNPDVTVRDRGVMEKCTYCIQRISQARIEADKQGRTIVDGEVRTACQQACPTQAIVFGDISNTGSEVSRRKHDVRDYALLEETNTRPRTTYGARIRAGEGKA
ncbi:TAT-variant-translocated molybdopterin oxidoreductase [Novosphingobium sp. PY1]|uniref:TAT-variant-translocated molybdopterin oxidoreductase n=1 Tax=Novosphingobium sp. PY1 TaxID=1882221 RepID=UPI001AA36645|nr:TAT-variant-translocated molybdopterin oxidoreductase [Novosphingobium sp. PY1]GFM30695.1 molybdopterin oxidoreductase [Novosphingobium sp. PY1]